MKFKNTIESPSNNKVKELIGIRDGNERDDLWFVEGLKVVETALSSGKKVEEILVTDHVLDRNKKLMHSVPYPETQITIIAEKVSKKLSDTMTPQGIFATVHYSFMKMNDLRPRGIIPVIDRVQDPGNLGTIIRTADAFGIKKMILLEGTCSPTNQKVIRSSAASVLNVDIVKTSEEELVTWATKNDIKLLASDSNATTLIKDVAPGKRSAILLGNESSGVSDYLKKKADMLFSIPLPGEAESLNVAIASAIILYEFSKKIKNT
jgi:TrmH family RNA methyltransferase